jgi:hypothetical protein
MIHTTKTLFSLIQLRQDDDLVGVGIHNTSDHDFQESFKVYLEEGGCFDIDKEIICEPDYYNDNKDDYEGLEEDGCIYNIYQQWDGFKKFTLEEIFKKIKTA